MIIKSYEVFINRYQHAFRHLLSITTNILWVLQIYIFPNLQRAISITYLIPVPFHLHRLICHIYCRCILYVYCTSGFRNLLL